MGKFPFTILALLLMAVILIAVTFFVQQKASISIDINGIDAKVPLVPESSENLNVKNLDWLGKDQPFYLVAASKSLSTDLTDFALTFTPKQDGEISIILKGLRAGGADESLAAEYHSVQITNAVLEKTDFKLLTDTPKLSALDGGMPNDDPDDKSAPPLLLAATGTSYKASISVRNGIPVTVKFSAKIVNKYRPSTKEKAR